MSMGEGIRPESPTVATRRRAESRRARSAVQREKTEWKFLIHQPRLSAPVQPRSCPPLRRTGPDWAWSSRPRRSPPLRVRTSIIFSDRAFALRVNASGRIQSAPPSMDTAEQNRKVLFVSSVCRWVNGGVSSQHQHRHCICSSLICGGGTGAGFRCCTQPVGHRVIRAGFWLLRPQVQHQPRISLEGWRVGNQNGHPTIFSRNFWEA